MFMSYNSSSYMSSPCDSIKISSASRNKKTLLSFMPYLFREDTCCRDFVQGHMEADRRQVGHTDFHTFPNPYLIDSDRWWVTASILSGSTQVDNDFSIISVAGPDQLLPSAAIILQAHRSQPSQRGWGKLKSFGCLSGGGRLFGRWLTAVSWSYLLFLRNVGSHRMRSHIYFHTSDVKDRKQEGAILHLFSFSQCSGLKIYSKTLYLSPKEANRV